MEITKTFYPSNREKWRKWLQRNHAKEKEIWLIYYKKNSGKPRIPYNDAVEEALCFGWIDSILKPINEEKYAQRFSPRRKGSKLSELNKERIRRLIKENKMTPAGLEKVRNIHDFEKEYLASPIKISPDILKALKADKLAWKNFQKFPESYKRIRIGWIETARQRPDIFQTRLHYFLKMTSKNKKFGMVQ